jgi:hypothetical protein
LGQYEEALAALARAEKQDTTDPRLRPMILAYRAMAEHRLGRLEQARATLARLREVAKGEGDPEAKAALHEAAMLIEGERAEQQR